MSYVWTADQVKRYFDYYPCVATRHCSTYLTFATTEEFARSVLPPCLEVADSPKVTISVAAFMEVIQGYPNRSGRDRAALIDINAKYGDKEGIYYLTVVETEEVNVETGREFWGMPKKLGTIDFFDDGSRFFGFAERKGYKLIEFDADLGPELGAQPDSTEYYFELRGHFGSNGTSLSSVELAVFDLPSVTHRFRALTNPHVELGASPVDTGVATIPLGEFVEGGSIAGEQAYSISDVIPLDGDGHDYAPYLLGRLYDDWPDLRDRASRRPAPTRFERSLA
jgi:acetoacetate decarboxylase